MKRFILPAACLLLAVLAPAVAWAGDDLAWKSTEKSIRRSSLGLQREVLDNGMISLVKEDHSAPVVAIQIWVGIGSIDEQEMLGAGLCHAIEHMIFKGTRKRTAGDITREIHDAGGDVNAYTTLDRTVFHTDIPSAHWRTGLNVLSDAVLNSTFPVAEWEKEREVILREFAMGYDDPTRVLSKLLWDCAFRVHPYRHPVIGHEEVFRTITRDTIADFFSRNYLPDRMSVVIIGDIDAAEVQAEIRQAFKDLKRKAAPPSVLPQEPEQLTAREVRKTGAFQVTRIEMAYPIVPLAHPDAATLDVLAEIVGHGRSSRLSRKLKEDRELAYDIHAWCYTPKQPGLFGVSATCEPSKETELLAALNREVEDWTRTSFTDAEIEKAKRNILASEITDLRTMAGQAESYASGEFYAGDPRFFSAYLRRVAGITSRDLRAVAARYLKPEHQTVAILAPESTEQKSAPAKVAPSGRPMRILLSNGIPLIFRQDSRIPLVSFCVAFKGGQLLETKADSGISRLTNDLLTRGAGSRSQEEIAEAVESLGAQIVPFSGFNSFGLQAEGLAQDAEKIAGILRDCALRPTFPPEEIAKAKTLQLALINKQQERPFEVARQALREALFNDHPYAWDSLGHSNTVAAISRDDIETFYRRHVARENLCLALFGDISLVQASNLMERCFGKVPSGTPLPSPALPGAVQLPARLEQHLPKEQAIVLIGFPGIAVTDPRREALQLLETSLSGLSSDLAMHIREERGLAYYMGAFQQMGLAPGFFTVYAGTRLDAAKEVETLMLEEIRRVARSGLREEELNRARNQLAADHDLTLQNNLALCQECTLDELYGLGYSHSFDTRTRLMNTTADDVRNAAAAIVNTNRMAISIVLPNGEK